MSEDEARAFAERASGRHLTLIEPYWARAWKQILRGATPLPPRPPRAPGLEGAFQPAHAESAWSLLGLAPGASLSEVKQAFRKRALETHPDQGGDAEAFVMVHQAYRKLCARLTKRPGRKG